MTWQAEKPYITYETTDQHKTQQFIIFSLLGILSWLLSVRSLQNMHHTSLFVHLPYLWDAPKTRYLLNSYYLLCINYIERDH